MKKENFIPQKLYPNHQAPFSAKEKVLNHVYSDYTGKQKKKSLLKNKILRYSSFALLFVLGFGVWFSFDQNNVSKQEKEIYAQELNQLISDSESNLNNLFAMIDEENTLEF